MIFHYQINKYCNWCATEQDKLFQHLQMVISLAAGSDSHTQSTSFLYYYVCDLFSIYRFCTWTGVQSLIQMLLPILPHHTECCQNSVGHNDMVHTLFCWADSRNPEHIFRNFSRSYEAGTDSGRCPDHIYINHWKDTASHQLQCHCKNTLKGSLHNMLN